MLKADAKEIRKINSMVVWMDGQWQIPINKDRMTNWIFHKISADGYVVEA